MTAFTLRDAAPADVPDVLRLVRGLAEYERLLHEVVMTEADLHAALFGPQPRAYAVLAHADGNAVGLALWYYTFSTFPGRPDIFLEDLFVEPAHRGRGIGLALLRHLAQRAVAENCRRIEWRVLNWNAAVDRVLRKPRRNDRCRTGTCGNLAARRWPRSPKGANHG